MSDAKPTRLHVLPRATPDAAFPAKTITGVDAFDFRLASHRHGDVTRAKAQASVTCRSDGTKLLQVTPMGGMTHSRIVTAETTFDEAYQWLFTVLQLDAEEHHGVDPTTDDSKVAVR